MDLELNFVLLGQVWFHLVATLVLVLVPVPL